MQYPRRWLNERETLYEPNEHFIHDPDDPEPREEHDFWYHFNRWCEESARWLRFWRLLP